MVLAVTRHVLPSSDMREKAACLRDSRRPELRRRKISSCGKRSEITRKPIKLVMPKTTLREKADGKV